MLKTVSSHLPTARVSSQSTNFSKKNSHKSRPSQLDKTKLARWLSIHQQPGSVWDSKLLARSSFGNGNPKATSSIKRDSSMKLKPSISTSTNLSRPVQMTVRLSYGTRSVDSVWLLFSNTSPKSLMSSSPTKTPFSPAVLMVVLTPTMWLSTKNSGSSNLISSAS